MLYREIEPLVEGLISEKKNAIQMPELVEIDQETDELSRHLTSQDHGPRIDAWRNFDRMFGAFRPNEFTVLCGTSGTGKTTLLANLSVQLMTGNIPHFVASVETGHLDYMARLISVMEREDLNTGDAISKEKMEAILKKWSLFLKRKMIVFSKYTTKVDPKKILHDIFYAHKKHGCKVAMIDNLNFLMPISDSSRAVENMDRVVHDFVLFCKNINMHIVMVMHPKKREDADGVARVENEYDIKGSSTVIQEAHNVLLFNRPTKSQEQDGYDRKKYRELKFAKLRRRGKYAGSRIMFECIDSAYYESKVFE